jgi:hypothetical protein
VSKFPNYLLVLLIAGLLLAWTGGASPVLAQSYTQLQVLLPGESAAPGTIDGKSGQPDTQTVGVPFNVTGYM